MTDDTLLYRASLVLDHILTDGRIMKISTAIKLLRPIFHWQPEEDEELRKYVADILRRGRHQTHVRAMQARRERRAARRRSA